MPVVLADYEPELKVGFDKLFLCDVSFYEVYFFLSFVVYYNLRLVASSCNIPATDGYLEEGICVRWSDWL